MDRCTITYNCAAPLYCAVKMAAMSSQRSGVRPSVCPIYRLLQQRAAGLLLGAPWAGDIDR